MEPVGDINITTGPVGRRIGGVTLAALTGFVFLMVVVLGTDIAGATFPGRNGEIAFSRIVEKPSGLGFREAIYNVSPDGERLRRLTGPAGLKDDPAFSPNGKRIAFAGFTHIFTMRSDGTKVRKITKGKRFRNKAFEDGDPAWSPNGKRLVFSRRFLTSKFTSDLFTVRADGTKLRELRTKNLDEADPVWSPDGETIAFVGDPSLGGNEPEPAGLYLMDPDGTDVRPLVETKKIGTGADWAPDGETLAFARRPEGNFRKTQVFTIAADGTDETKLTNEKKDAFDPVFSPNGKRIAFNRNGVLNLINAGGGKSSQLLAKRHIDGRNDRNLSWQAR